MKVYLVRHAVAADRGEEYPDDTRRPLTPHGISRFKETVEGLAALGVRVDVVLSSPLVRARQTAELLAAGLQDRPPVVDARWLAAGNPAAAAIDALAGREDVGSVALVGHEPGIGELAARLVGAQTPFVFKKGGVCRIDFDGPARASAGELRWFATPRMLRCLR